MSKPGSFSMRSFTSLLLAFSFLALALSGIILYFAPQCSVAEAMGWTAAGLTKDQLTSLHMSTALMVVILSLFHLFVFNWKTFVHHLKIRRGKAPIRFFKPEVLTSFVLAIFIIGGSAWILYPFSLLPEGHEAIEQYYRDKSGFEGRGAGHRQSTIILEGEAVHDTLVIRESGEQVNKPRQYRQRMSDQQQK